VLRSTAVARVPGLCRKCNRFFPTPVDVVGEGSVSVQSFEISECPYCGGGAYIPDGVYKSVGDAITLLSAPATTIQTLRRLQQILVDARDQSKDAEAVAAQIQQELPGFKKLADWLPATRGELYPFIGLILTVIGLLLTHVLKNDGPKPSITINQVFERVVQVPVPTASPPKPKPHRREMQNVGPNKRCPCNSGKKFKKCHGDPSRSNPQ
jgi:hypothetical protein